MIHEPKNTIDNGGILDTEYSIISKYYDIAEKNVNKRRNIIKRILRTLSLAIFPPMTIDSKRWDDQEFEIEFERLMKLEGNKVLHKLRPDIYKIQWLTQTTQNATITNAAPNMTQTSATTPFTPAKSGENLRSRKSSEKPSWKTI